MENIWQMLKDIIYDKSAIISLCDLMEEIRKAFLLMNGSKQENIINLFDTFKVKVVVNNDSEINNYLCVVLFSRGDQ